MYDAGRAKINTTDRKTIKSNGNLPIPHSENANAKVVSCILIFLGQAEFIRNFSIFESPLSKSYCDPCD